MLNQEINNRETNNQQSSFNTPESPVYVLSQIKSRAIIPKIISFLILGAIFYLGVLLNLSLLELNPVKKNIVEMGSIILLSFVVLLGIILAIRRAGRKYLFYSQQIVWNKENIAYNAITNVLPRKNFLDKVFKTQSFPLNKEFTLKHIAQEIPLQSYLQQLVDYAKSQDNFNGY